MSPRLRLAAGIGLLLATALPVVAGQFGRFFLPSPTSVEYDSRFAFTRIRYGTRVGGNGGWEHDYPQADRNFAAILDYTTHMRVHLNGSNIFDLDDPRIFENPVIYLSEPGGWTTDEAEATNLRKYLLKGGFIIFDDFREWDWDNLVEQMRRVLPQAQWVELDSSHPIFHSFFEIDDLTYLTSYGNRMPTYWGIFEENDRNKRLIALANRDNDLGEYWEFSDTGYAPVDLSNQAYKFGVNYFIYGLTH